MFTRLIWLAGWLLIMSSSSKLCDLFFSANRPPGSCYVCSPFHIWPVWLFLAASFTFGHSFWVTPSCMGIAGFFLTVKWPSGFFSFLLSFFFARICLTGFESVVIFRLTWLEPGAELRTRTGKQKKSAKVNRFGRFYSRELRIKMNLSVDVLFNWKCSCFRVWESQDERKFNDEMFKWEIWKCRI